MPAARECIGGYRIVRRLGSGGMGEVFEAERRGQRVAIKLFSADGASVDFYRRRFAAEARLLARLSHPRLVKVRDFGTDEATGRPFIVMDLVVDAQGRARTLAEVSPADADEARLAGWFGDLASVVDYIHAKGVVHRDIKLNNVLIDAGGHAVLTDFGISRVCNEDLRREIDVTRTMITGSQTERNVLGTRGYMAPELLAGASATPASDAYALAVSFFRLLTGVWYDPNLGGDRNVGARHLLGLDDMLGLFEYDWKGVLGAMLDSDPARRATEIAPLAARLSPVSAATPARRAVRRGLVVTAAVAVVVLAAAVAAALWLGRGQRPPPDPAPAPSAPAVPKARPKLTEGLFSLPRFMENG